MIGEQIKQLRKSLNLTQQEFSDRIGVKRNTLAQYESCRNQPLDAVINLICREFDVNENWLRTGEGEMHVNLSVDEYLNTFAREHNLDEDERRLVEKFINMTPNQRHLLIYHIKEIMKFMEVIV